MKQLIRLTILTLCVFVLIFLPLAKSEAAIFNSLDERLDAMPASVIVAGSENFTGKTTDGQDFFQYRIVSDPTIRIQKFIIGDLQFYISDYGVFSANDDLQAISIYFSLV